MINNSIKRNSKTRNRDTDISWINNYWSGDCWDSPIHLLDNSEDIKIFDRTILSGMPVLVKEGRLPFSIADIMQKRLDVLTDPHEDFLYGGLRSTWWDISFNTGDGIFFHPNGNVKIVPNSQLIRDLTKDSLIMDWQLILGKDKDHSIMNYNLLEGTEIKARDLVLEGTVQTQKESKANPILKALVPDKNLLNEYIDATFAQAKERLYPLQLPHKFTPGYVMGTHIYQSTKKIATGALFCISSILKNSQVYNLNPLYEHVYRPSWGVSYIKRSNYACLVGSMFKKFDTPDRKQDKYVSIPNPGDIVNNIYSYLTSITINEKISRKGIERIVFREFDSYDLKLNRGVVHPRDIVNNIYSYLTSITINQKVKRKELLNIVKDGYIKDCFK